MPREKLPDPPADDVPSWVMTFSDVITLLMTFFILLLTFATNQPETFDRVRVSMFGGGSSTGFASESTGVENDALLVRTRARSGRVTREGSEMPPIHSDPALATLSKGIAGLEDDEVREPADAFRISKPLDVIFNPNDELQSTGKQIAKMLARQMRVRPISLDIAVASEENIPAAQTLVDYLTKEERIHHASVGIAHAPHQVTKGQLVLVINHMRERRGPKD